MYTSLFWSGGLGVMIPRMIFGALFIAHGWPKVKDLRQNGANFSGMGFKPGWLWGTVAALVEFFGGIGLVLGLWTPYICALFMGEFVVIIIWKFFKKIPFIGGWELDAIIFAFALLFFTLYRGWSLI